MTAPHTGAVPIGWQRYVAIGDSMTEGLWDETGPTTNPAGQDPASSAVEPALRGWADRLAEVLSARRMHDGAAPLDYANLAVRGRLLGPITTEQLPTALAATPDLISIVGGGNDLLRPNASPDRLAGQLERAVRTARATGADVLLATGADTRFAPLLAAIRPKVAVFNAHVWSIARRTGAYVVDVWGLRALQDERMWAEDRIHLTPEGHHRVAQAALVGLGLEPDDADYGAPLPARVRASGARRQKLRRDVTWLREDVGPWAARHLRGHSSGDGRGPKRPELTPVQHDPGEG